MMPSWTVGTSGKEKSQASVSSLKVLTEREAAGAMRKKRKRTEVSSSPSRPGLDRLVVLGESQNPAFQLRFASCCCWLILSLSESLSQGFIGTWLFRWVDANWYLQYNLNSTFFSKIGFFCLRWRLRKKCNQIYTSALKIYSVSTYYGCTTKKTQKTQDVKSSRIYKDIGKPSRE